MIEPMSDRILVEMEEEKTVGGIIIPDMVKNGSRIGIVVGVGYELSGVSVGDRVMVGRHGTEDFEYEGKSYKVITKNHIVVKMT